MHTMSKFQDDCFRSIEMIKKLNMNFEKTYFE